MDFLHSAVNLHLGDHNVHLCTITWHLMILLLLDVVGPFPTPLVPTYVAHN